MDGLILTKICMYSYYIYVNLNLNKVNLFIPKKHFT